MATAAPNVPTAAVPSADRSHRVVGSYTDYAAAQKAVDYLSDEKFPVEHVAIVGRGLKFVEQVTGRLNYGRAALNGLASGVGTGLFIGLLLALFIVPAPGDVFAWPVVLWAAGIGALFGLVFGLIGYALTGGKRDFTSVGAMAAETYDVLVDAEHADEAARVLSGMPA